MGLFVRRVLPRIQSDASGVMIDASFRLLDRGFHRHHFIVILA